jgi:hypothetical protein
VKVRWKAEVDEFNYSQPQSQQFHLRGTTPATIPSSSTARGSTHIAKVHDPKLAETAHDLTADFVSDVQLRQGHIRRAEQRVLVRRHAEDQTELALSAIDVVVGSVVLLVEIR